jgi:hypothetical protein
MLKTIMRNFSSEKELRLFCNDIKEILGEFPTIVELGSYMGESSLIFAQEFPKGKIICIDSWEGGYDNQDSASRANYIDVIDRAGSDYPNNTLAFTFSGNNSSELFRLNHAANPMTNTPTYRTPTPARPYVEVVGDIRVRGAIRFSDFTSLDSASFLTDIDVLESGLVSANNSINYLNQSFLEGYVGEQINAPNNASVPTTGTLTLKNNNWSDAGQITLVNRDTTSIIHAGAYVIAIRVNNEYRPLWVSASDTKCQCCR